MDTPISTSFPIQPAIEDAIGELAVGQFVKLRMIFRTDGLLDSSEQFTAKAPTI